MENRHKLQPEVGKSLCYDFGYLDDRGLHSCLVLSFRYQISTVVTWFYRLLELVLRMQLGFSCSVLVQSKFEVKLVKVLATVTSK